MALVVLGALAAASCGSNHHQVQTGETDTAPTSIETTVPPVTTPALPVPAAPSDSQPLRLLLLGDGVMWDATPAMTAAAAALGPSVVRSESYWGFGLSRPDWRDWPVLWPSYVAEFHPTVVVVAFGIHDTEPRTVDGADISPPGVKWARWYADQVRQAMADLTSGGAFVYWLGMPPVGDPSASARISSVNRVVERVVDLDQRGRYVEPAAAFSDADDTAAPLSASGRPLRKIDLLHLCAEGAAVLAESFTDAIAADIGAPVDPSYLTGPWRADDRYDWDGPPGCRR